MSHCLFVFSIRLMMLRNVPVVRAAEPVFLEVHIEFGEVEGRAQMLMQTCHAGNILRNLLFHSFPKTERYKLSCRSSVPEMAGKKC